MSYRLVSNILNEGSFTNTLVKGFKRGGIKGSLSRLAAARKLKHTKYLPGMGGPSVTRKFMRMDRARERANRASLSQFQQIM